MDKSIQKELVAEMLKNPEAVAAIVNSSSAMVRALIEESLFKPCANMPKQTAFYLRSVTNSGRNAKTRLLVSASPAQ